MSLFESKPSNGVLPFPKSLTTEYQPQTVSEFVGLEKHKRILTNLVANPRECSLLFEGGPGTGKTSMAYAFARDMGAEVHHIGSQQANVDDVKAVVHMCHYVPLSGGWHVIIMDEADKMSPATQLYLLSKLDGSETVPRTIWIFTCNVVDPFQDRFLSRCIRVPKFHSVGAGKEVKSLLARIWADKVKGSESPDFDKVPTGNVREALQWLEVELLAA